MEDKKRDHEWHRDFTLNALPRNESGEVLYRGSSDEEYLAYAEWLANYLYEVRFEPNPEQNLLGDFVRRCEPETAMEMIAENAAFHDSDVECVLFARLMEEEGEENPGAAERMQYLDVPRILREEQERLEKCPEAEENFCDVGWRTPLAAVLKNIPQPEERIDLIRNFFLYYQEYSRK